MRGKVQCIRMDYLHVGENIKRCRKGRMTQVELAQRLGKSVSSVKKYELGLVEIPYTVFEQIAEILEISPQALQNYDLPGDDTFMRYLQENGYSITQDESGEVLLMKTPEGTYKLESGDLESIHQSLNDYLRSLIGELVVHRPRLE